MGFTTEEHMVRCDIFDTNGKWRAMEAVDFSNCFELDTYTACKKALANSLYGRWLGRTAVILRPYCTYSFPTMLKLPVDIGGWEIWKRNQRIDYSEEE